MAFVYWIRDKTLHTDMTCSGYIGVTVKSVSKRFNEHVRSVLRGSKLRIHSAMRNAQGRFTIEALLEGSEEYCYFMENRLRPLPCIGLNMSAGGNIAPRTGVKLSPETCAKLRNNNLGKKLPNSWRLAMSKASKGKPKSVSHRENISLGHLGKLKSAQHVENMRIAAKLQADTHKGWEWYNSDLLAWASAIEIHALIVLTNCGTLRAANYCGRKRGHLVTMVRDIKAGWNPNTDEAYQLWLTQYKQKECNESTQTT